MENAPVPGHSTGPYDLIAAMSAPPKPAPTPDTMWRGGSPYLIVGNGQRYTLGWQDTKKEGPCFVLAQVSVMRNKVLDRFPMTAHGWARAWAALVELDAGAARAVAGKLQEWLAAGAERRAEQEHLTQVFDDLADAGGATVFRWLGVQVPAGGGKVYTIGFHNPQSRTNTSKLLGPLAGAQAMVTDGSQAWSPGRAMFLPIGLAGLATKTKADAAVVFPDGRARATSLDGNYAVREAQKQVLQFNAMANASAPAATAAGSGPATRLQKLQELRAAGLLTQEEYEAKRAEVINSI